MSLSNPKHYIYVSIAASIVTMLIKGYAWYVSNSVAVLTDATEATINFVAAIFALSMLHLASRPPDDTHDFGHAKAEYFSTGVEGFLIVFAGAGIGIASFQRIMSPEPFQELSLGLGLVIFAGVVNWATAKWLEFGFKRTGSVVLKADASHLMVDVWTSVLLIVGLVIASFKELWWLDATLGVAFSFYIIYNGLILLRSSAISLMDTSLEVEDLAKVKEILSKFEEQHGIQFHALRSRQSADRNYISMHVLVPGNWSVNKGHDILESIEHEINNIIPNSSVFTHLEPLNDPSSFYDIDLERSSFKNQS